MGTYDVVGSLKWLKEPIYVTTSNDELPLREAVLYDGTRNRIHKVDSVEQFN